MHLHNEWKLPKYTAKKNDKYQIINWKHGAPNKRKCDWEKTLTDPSKSNQEE